MHRKMPQSLPEWYDEIVEAYQDVAETIPLGPIVGADMTDADLYHLAPLVCLKFRGFENTKEQVKTVTEAALATYIANEQIHGSSLAHAIMAFSLCYVTSHYALDLIEEETCQDILDYMVEHLDELQEER